MELRTDITPHAAVIVGVLQGGTAHRLVDGRWYTYGDHASALVLMLDEYKQASWRLKSVSTVRWAPVLCMPGGSEIIESFRSTREAACNQNNYEDWSSDYKLVRLLRLEYDEEGIVSSSFETVEETV